MIIAPSVTYKRNILNETYVFLAVEFESAIKNRGSYSKKLLPIPFTVFSKNIKYVFDDLETFGTYFVFVFD